MKTALALLLLIASQGMAVAPGTKAFYRFAPSDPTADSSGNGYTLTTGGTPAYSTTTGVCGSGSTQAFGPVAAVGDSLITPAGLTAVMNGKTTWTIEGYVYFTSTPASLLALFGPSTGGNVGPLLYCEGTTDNFRLYMDGAFGDNIVFTAGAVSSVCINFAITCDGSSTKAYFDNALKYTGAAFAWPNRAISFGARNANNDGPLTTGYVDEIRISDIARTSFPTSDAIGGDEDCLFLRLPCE